MTSESEIERLNKLLAEANKRADDERARAEAAILAERARSEAANLAERARSEAAIDKERARSEAAIDKERARSEAAITAQVAATLQLYRDRALLHDRQATDVDLPGKVFMDVDHHMEDMRVELIRVLTLILSTRPSNQRRQTRRD